MSTLRKDKTGAEIEIRLIHPDDEGRLRFFYEGLSDETIRSFYRVTGRREYFIQRSVIIQECNVDLKEHLYMVAIHDDEIVGLETLIRTDMPSEYEISHLISDEYQSRGIGSILMEETLSYVRKYWRRHFTITAETALSNYKAKGFMKKFGFAVKNSERGEISWVYKIS
ncbi:MAG: GNAT family N-acetyltransferase [Candidatus Paceibacterota bacterium]|jgi:ribosomal protein S18 acetylase RimI-like enzyme|nr:GNAT family N-acetyltransferase [Candidatus Paceibacterota bacterium]